MPHSMKYPTTRLPPREPAAAELDGPAAANAAATATAARITKTATKRPDGFIVPSPSGGVPEVVRTTSRCRAASHADRSMSIAGACARKASAIRPAAEHGAEQVVLPARGKSPASTTSGQYWSYPHRALRDALAVQPSL